MITSVHHGIRHAEIHSFMASCHISDVIGDSPVPEIVRLPIFQQFVYMKRLEERAGYPTEYKLWKGAEEAVVKRVTDWIRENRFSDKGIIDVRQRGFESASETFHFRIHYTVWRIRSASDEGGKGFMPPVGEGLAVTAHLRQLECAWR